MYQSESMIQMLEDMQHQANEMEKSIKDMLEVEGRAIGIEPVSYTHLTLPTKA